MVSIDCACFWESVHVPGVAIRRKSDVHIRANKQSRLEMESWNLGWTSANDEHIILTENGVQKARSLHRVPLENQ